MFKKLVAVEPVNIPAAYQQQLSEYAQQVQLYPDAPADNQELLARIGEADAVLLSYTTTMDGSLLRACPGLRYIGMCCSLYGPESANVDIRTAESLGITVSGVAGYGDEGVPEYVVSELVRLLHGFGPAMWKDYPCELAGLQIGILGLGLTGGLVARALQFFGAHISYFARSRKGVLEASTGYTFLPLPELLPKVEILCTCLNKNVVLLHEKELALFGNGKIIVNTSISPGHDVAAMKKWLAQPGNFLLSDTPGGIDPAGELLALPNVFCTHKPAGMTKLAQERLGQGVIANIAAFLQQP